MQAQRQGSREEDHSVIAEIEKAWKQNPTCAVCGEWVERPEAASLIVNTGRVVHNTGCMVIALREMWLRLQKHGVRGLKAVRI
jgi:hypothetical protein